MKKDVLLSFISKYSLGNKIENCVWNVENGKVKARATLSTTAVVIEMTYNGFDEITIPPMGVSSAQRVEKIISALSDDIKIKPKMVGDKPIALIMTDDNDVVASYALSDASTLLTVPPFKQLPPMTDAYIKINEKFANTFNKAKSALLDAQTFTLSTTDTSAKITVGKTDVNVDSIIIPVETEKVKKIHDLVFDAELFRQVLIANKGIESVFKVSEKGIGIIEYDTPEYTAKYYFVQSQKSKP